MANDKSGLKRMKPGEAESFSGTTIEGHWQEVAEDDDGTYGPFTEKQRNSTTHSPMSNNLQFDPQELARELSMFAKKGFKAY